MIHVRCAHLASRRAGRRMEGRLRASRRGGKAEVGPLAGFQRRAGLALPRCGRTRTAPPPVPLAVVRNEKRSRTARRTASSDAGTNRTILRGTLNAHMYRPVRRSQYSSKRGGVSIPRCSDAASRIVMRMQVSGRCHGSAGALGCADQRRLDRRGRLSYQATTHAGGSCPSSRLEMLLLVVQVSLTGCAGADIMHHRTRCSEAVRRVEQEAILWSVSGRRGGWSTSRARNLRDACSVIS